MATTVEAEDQIKYNWLNDLNEPWQKELIAEFVVPFRTKGELTPCGPTGKKVLLDKFRPILIITIYDAWSLLWGYAHRPSKKLTVEEQIESLRKSQELLMESITTIQPNIDLRPATVNLTYSDQVTERERCEIYNGYVDSLSTIGEKSCNRDKGKEHADLKVVEGCEECSNQATIKGIQARFGELLRNGCLGGDVWETTAPLESCRFVHPHSHYTYIESPGSTNERTNESPRTMSLVQPSDGKHERSSRCNDPHPLILVHTFKDKSRIEASIDFKVHDSDPKELVYYIKRVAEFGFNHIIIIGETNFGVVFLDCFGRVFQWDDESVKLWLLGNSPEEAGKDPVIGEDQLAWFVMDGVVYEYIKKWEDLY